MFMAMAIDSFTIFASSCWPCGGERELELELELEL